MSTKAAIGIENADGTITGIFCYYDGYLEGVGQILNKHYTKESTVKHLIENGNIKYLGDNVWATEYFIREHKELNNKSQTLSNVQDFERYFNNIPYFYIFSKNKWICRQNSNELLNYCDLSNTIELIRERNMLK